VEKGCPNLIREKTSAQPGNPHWGRKKKKSLRKSFQLTGKVVRGGSVPITEGGSRERVKKLLQCGGGGKGGEGTKTRVVNLCDCQEIVVEEIQNNIEPGW